MEVVLYIAPIVISIGMIACGFIAYRFPLEYSTEYIKYPAYWSKRAKDSKHNWDIAQHSYGKYMIICGCINILLTYLSVYAISRFIKDEIILFVTLLLPSFVLIGVGNWLTEIKLKTNNRK